MGKITILSRTVSAVPKEPFDKNDYDLSGSCHPRGILVCDNFFSPDADEQWRLYVHPRAAQTILEFIHWGTHHPANRVEQGGFLLGYCAEDEEKQMTCCHVEEAVPAVSASGTAAFLNLPPSDMAMALNVCSRLNALRPERPELRIVGWFHTHPNSLDVFMSGTDRNTQSTLFSRDDAFSIVLNPHRRIWKCYRSRDCISVCGQMLLGEALTDLMERGRIFNSYGLRPAEDVSSGL